MKNAAKRDFETPDEKKDDGGEAVDLEMSETGQAGKEPATANDWLLGP
jgi:hypothetical protein